MITQLAALIGIPRWAVIASVAAAIAAAFLLWLSLHDAGVRTAERDRIDREARAKLEKATRAADKADAKRQETIHETAADLRNSASDDEWLERMRQRQQSATPAR